MKDLTAFSLCDSVTLEEEGAAEIMNAIPRNFVYSDLIIKSTSPRQAQIECHCHFVIL